MKVFNIKKNTNPIKEPLVDSQEEELYTPQEEELYTPQEEELYTPQEEELYTPQEEQLYTTQEEELYTTQEEELYTSQEEELYTTQEEQLYTAREEGLYTPQENEMHMPDSEDRNQMDDYLDDGYEDFDETLAASRRAISAEEPDDDFPNKDFSDEEYSDDEYSDDDFLDDDFLEEGNTKPNNKKKQTKQKQSNDASFLYFSKNIVSNINNRVKKNPMAFYLILGAVLIIIVSVVIFLVNGKEQGAKATQSASDNEIVSSTDSSMSVIPVPEDPMLENAYPEVNALIEQYFAARQSNDVATLQSIRTMSTIELIKTEILSNYVEEYRDITCYTKAGPFPDSYIAYVSYYEKFKDWEPLAPSLLSLLVCTKEDGTLYIYNGDLDQNVADYIRVISTQEDVRFLIERVNTEYIEIMDSNTEFAAFIEGIHNEIKERVGEQLAIEASASENEADEEAISDNTASDHTASENTADDSAASTMENFEVRALTTVNVRTSDSELADRLGRVEIGTILSCEEQMQNGWSRVIYEGKTGYIKSEFLELVGGVVATEDAIGTVTTTDTVNIRSSANVDGQKLGVAYAGETFDLLERGNEWTKIIYQGREAYIKTEFIE